jgi:hypothetical protein
MLTEVIHSLPSNHKVHNSISSETVQLQIYHSNSSAMVELKDLLSGSNSRLNQLFLEQLNQIMLLSLQTLIRLFITYTPMEELKHLMEYSSARVDNNV